MINNLIKTKNINEIIDYLAIIIMLLCSGAVIFLNNNKVLSISALVVCFVIFVIRRKEIGKRESLKYCTIFLIVYVLFCCIRSINNIFGIFDEFGTVVLILIAFTGSYSIKPKEFFKKYNNILVVLAASSIILYLLPFIFPKFPSIFPIVKDYAGNKYNNALLYCYPIHLSSFYRNQSIFWEPAAFQAFLNMAIFFELYLLNNKKTNLIKISILILALLLTKSTTGYIILIILILGQIPKIKKFLKKFDLKKFKEKKAFRILFYVFIIILSLAVIFLLKKVIFEKFSPQKRSFLSFRRRLFDIIIDVKLLFSSFYSFIFGLGENAYIKAFSSGLNSFTGGASVSASSSNSITFFAAKYGIVSAISIYYIYFKSFLSFSKIKDRIIFIIIILLCLFTESFIFVPVFLAFAIQLIDYPKVINKEMI